MINKNSFNLNSKKLSVLLRTKKISILKPIEKERYLNFFSESYRENLDHCRFNLVKFPRWSIISGYYAMHDITKLLLADKFNIKVNFNVHQTTIEVFGELIGNREALIMLNLAYSNFIQLLNDLSDAKNKRTTVQYYTGTQFLKDKYKRDSVLFLNHQVLPFLNKIKLLQNDYK